MLLRPAYLSMTDVFALLRLLPMSDRGKDVEIVVLRHQITVLERQLRMTQRRFSPADRAFLAALLHRPRGDSASSVPVAGTPGNTAASTANYSYSAPRSPHPLACDFFEVPTVSGTRPYVLAVIEHSSRRIRVLGGEDGRRI